MAFAAAVIPVKETAASANSVWEWADADAKATIINAAAFLISSVYAGLTFWPWVVGPTELWVFRPGFTLWPEPLPARPP